MPNLRHRPIRPVPGAARPAGARSSARQPRTAMHSSAGHPAAPPPGPGAYVAPARPESTTHLESFTYDDAIVRKFLVATFGWGLIGMLVGLVIALQLANPWFNTTLPWLSFGRLRPLHTNAVIFAPGSSLAISRFRM